MVDYRYGAALYGSQTYGPTTVPPASGDAPIYNVEISFGPPTAGTFQVDLSQLDVGTLGQPFATDAYQTVPGLRTATFRRGRQDELGTSEVGTCDLVLRNGDGRYSPGNPGSPYFPNVLPLRRIRLTALWQGEIYPLFCGFIESYQPVEVGPFDSDIKIHALDFLGIAPFQPVSATFPAQDDGARVGALLALLNTTGLPATLDPSGLNLVAGTLVAADPVQHLHDIETSARGFVFCGPDGGIVYQNMWHRFTAARSTTVQGTFGGPDPTTGRYPAGTLPYMPGADYALDTRYLFNRVTVQATGTAEAAQTADDIPSQDLYFLRALPPIAATLLDAGQALGVAQRLLSGYKDAHPRLHSIVVEGGTDTDGTLWPHVLGRDLSDRIHVRQQMAGNVPIDGDFFIESREDTISAVGSHRVTWQLSAAEQAGVDPFFLDTSQLDQGRVG